MFKFYGCRYRNKTQHSSFALYKLYRDFTIIHSSCSTWSWNRLSSTDTICPQLDFAMVALGFQKTRGETKAGRPPKAGPAGSQSILETIIDDGTVKTDLWVSLDVREKHIVLVQLTKQVWCFGAVHTASSSQIMKELILLSCLKLKLDGLVSNNSTENKFLLK